MDFFYKPAPGVLGDCIPYYADGRYHVFYLRDFRDSDSYGTGAPWHHLSTVDFVHFEDHGEAFPRGRVDEQDYTTGTGGVFTDGSGTHHIFYTGINPYFRTRDHHEQALMHAVSDDLMTWTKVSGQVWPPNEALFERHDWRDPFIYTHPDTGAYCMLIAARLRDGPISRRGCTALLTSDDLITWSSGEPFYAPSRFHGHECPDWFQWNDWYYLVFSEYTMRTTTRYVMSRSPDGPWISPDGDQFDNRAFYAAKTASDGNRRFLFGWNPTKRGDVDHGDWQWGGCLTVHEVVQQADGTLTVRFPPEAADAFGHARSIQFEPPGSGWDQTGDVLRVDSPAAYTAALGDRLPETCLLRGELRFEGDAGTAGVLLGMDETAGSGYFLRFDLREQRLEFGRIGGYRPWYVDRMPELDRAIAIRPREPIRLSIVIDGTAVVAYVDDRVALSARMYAGASSRCGLFADGAAISTGTFDLLTRHP